MQLGREAWKLRYGVVYDCGVEEGAEYCGTDSDGQHAAKKLAQSAWHQLSHGFTANTDDGFLAPVPLVTSPE